MLSKEPRPGAGTRIGQGVDTASPAIGPGKRTLTEALPSPTTAFAKADDGGSGGGGGGGGSGMVDGGVDADTPPVSGPPKVKAPPPDVVTGSKDMVVFVVEARGQQVQIYVSPGGINQTPDVFMFFHGYYANLGIDPKVKPKSDDNASGEDTAAAAMKQAKAPNTLAMLPQGVQGDSSNDGGHMPALDPANAKEKTAKNTFPLFLDEILVKVAAQLNRTDTLTPRHIGIAGHSGGGYKGVHDALDEAGGYDDKITDVTLMDSSYTAGGFKSTSAWMFKGSPGKTVRIVESQGQLDHGWVKDPENPKGPKLQVDPWHKKYFGEAELADLAKQHKMSIKKLAAGEDRGNSTTVVQHTQVLTADNKVQCDVLIMHSGLGHHEIRDNVMDDAIDSIGQGAQGNVDFGKNQIADYGRDPALPHDGNTEPKPPPKPPKKSRRR